MTKLAKKPPRSASRAALDVATGKTPTRIMRSAISSSWSRRSKGAMRFEDDGTTTWRGCRFIAYLDLSPNQRSQARKRFDPVGRRDGWEKIERWAFAVRKDGKLAACPYIEPLREPQPSPKDDQP